MMENFDQIEFQNWMKGDPVVWLRATKRDAPTINKLRPAFFPYCLNVVVVFFCVIINDVTYIRYIAFCSLILNVTMAIWILLKIYYRSIYPIEQFIIKNLDEYETPENIFNRLNQISASSEIPENEKVIADIILGNFKTNLR